MITYTTDQLYKIFQQLPEGVREAMISIDTVDQLEAIAEKNKLHLDQAGLLAKEIGLVMLGITELGDFPRVLESRLALNREQTARIVSDINEAIFSKVREQIKESTKIREHVMMEEITPAGSDVQPAPATNERNLFEQRMGKLFAAPREERTSVPSAAQPSATSRPADPYREPTV